MLAAGVAHADTPGAPDDALVPVVDAALAVHTPRGFSLEGGEGTTYFDGFAMPLFYRDGRSALSIGGEPPRLVDDAEASEANGVRIDVTTPHGLTALELGTGQGKLAMDVTERGSHLGGTVRMGPEHLYVEHGSIDVPPLAFDGSVEARVYRSEHLDIDLHFLELIDLDSGWTDGIETPDHHVNYTSGGLRANLLVRYHDGPWKVKLDRSFALEVFDVKRGLVQHTRNDAVRFESRDEIRRTYEQAGGLSEVEWISGLETRISDYTRDVADAAEPRENVARARGVTVDDVSHAFDATVWRPDFALSTGMKAHLAPRIAAYAGLRLDVFSGDAAFEPRGELAVGCGRLTCRLAAGAYRRPAEEGEELEHPELHPERTTRISLSADHARGELRFYYADQTRLIVRDPLGHYANTGRGTTYGAYGVLRGHVGKFATQLAVRLEHAERQDGPRLLVRPYELDQPIRLEARIERELRGWRFGARFELREGLPSTAVAGAAYDSDRDVYLPSFGPLYGERLPWQHQLDLRIDRTWKISVVKLVAFLDIANVYDHRAAVDWIYNFNYTQRRAVEALPFWPTLGVRGEL